jgi:hypothetical protein
MYKVYTVIWEFVMLSALALVLRHQISIGA